MTDFPSGSSIAYHNDKFYLIGDDASHVLILDLNYSKIDSITLFNHPEKRIPKSEKADFEASTIIQVDNEPYLLLSGSASREERKSVILIPLSSLDLKKPHVQKYYDATFIDRILSLGIKDINIEGVTATGNLIILANRGNQSNPKNHLIITDSNFWEKQDETPIHLSQLLLPVDPADFIGISEVYYLKSNDILFVTLSSENTMDSYQDGVIGNSYIGWINDFTIKLNSAELKLDGLFNLADGDDELKNEKIEGICVESVNGNEYILHLVSDNDQGESKLFKLRMVLKK